MLKEMGLIRVVGVLALVAACDKGKVEPAKGSAQPTPAPLPVPDPQPIPDAGSDSSVFVRLCNDTGFDLTGLTYHQLAVGDLAKGACSAYSQTAHAYNYTAVAFRIKGKPDDKDEQSIQPIDYVGETPLDPGHWSYHLTADDRLEPRRTFDIRARKEKGDGTGPPGKLRIRACNDMDHDIAIIEMATFEYQAKAGVKARTCSEYRDVDRAFLHPYVDFYIGPTDFKTPPSMDATSLEPGDWSYHVTIADERKHIADAVAKEDKP
jgi:hypothetical protein